MSPVSIPRRFQRLPLVILVLRTYALYRSKALLALLSFFCSVGAVPALRLPCLTVPQISAATMMGASLYLSVNVVERKWRSYCRAHAPNDTRLQSRTPPSLPRYRSDALRTARLPYVGGC